MSVIPDFQGATELAEIQERFVRSARSIMLEHDLKFERSPTALQITHLELYLFCESWPDPNTDQNNEQRNSGTWYLHHRGTNANRSRLDITCGSPSAQILGGILIRGINGVDGSGKAIKRIIRGEDATALSWLEDELQTLKTEIAGKSVFDGLLRLERRKEARKGDHLLEARKGLRYSASPWDAQLHISVPPI